MPFRSRMPAHKCAFARAMRNSPSPPEALLWSYLRRGQLGAKFRRQSPMLGWIADFYCPEYKLVVEVDGAHHDPVADAKRDAAMTSHGLKVLRLPASDVMRQPICAVALISAHIA